jgi:cytoskeletal protein CcmA (bactofilin family)
MGVKNNFSQAVSELIGISRNVEPENKNEGDEEPAKALEAEEATGVGTEEEDTINEMAEMEDSNMTAEQKSEAPQTIQNPKERIMAMLAAQQAQQSQAQQTQEVPQPEQASQQVESAGQQTSNQIQPPKGPRTENGGGVTTIAKGTVIIGEINADGDVELLGSVKGKIASQGDIKANGKVIGDLIGRDIELVACAVQGNIIASGMVTVDGDSVVVGDVKGENFCLDGKIKGNVTVEKEAKFQPKAILAGNVTTASIAMSQGAKIQGEVNIPLSEKETDMSFDIDMII